MPFDPLIPVDTDWDLGIDDNMCIWFSQSPRSGQVRLIDYYENNGEGLPHYVQMLAARARERGYTYGQHWAPHDIQVRELGTGKSRLEIAAALGLKFKIAPRLTVEDGIHAVRLFLAKCWFDETRTAVGVDALRHYRKRFNATLQEFTGTPLHDRYSHAADAFRGLVVRHKVAPDASPAVPPTPPPRSTWG